MKRLRHVLAVIGILALLSGALFGCGNDESKGKVVLGYVEWDSEVASTNVVKTVLEDQGYNVDIKAVDAGVMWAGISEGDFDGIVAAWLPGTHGEYFEQVKDKVEDLGPNLEGAKIGLAVPSYMDIDSIEDLNDIAGDVNGEIIGIEPGAGIMMATERAIEDYDLNFTIKDSSTAAMTATLKDKIEKEEPIVATEWTPHWPFVAYDIKYLDDPKGSFGADEWIATIVRPDLKDDMPEVYNILDNFHWEPADMEAVMLDVSEGMSPEDAAAKWVGANQDKVSKWIE